MYMSLKNNYFMSINMYIRTYMYNICTYNYIHTNYMYKYTIIPPKPEILYNKCSSIGKCTLYIYLPIYIYVYMYIIIHMYVLHIQENYLSFLLSQSSHKHRYLCQVAPSQGTAVPEATPLYRQTKHV